MPAINPLKLQPHATFKPGLWSWNSIFRLQLQHLEVFGSGMIWSIKNWKTLRNFCNSPGPQNQGWGTGTQIPGSGSSHRKGGPIPQPCLEPVLLGKLLLVLCSRVGNIAVNINAFNIETYSVRNCFCLSRDTANNYASKYLLFLIASILRTVDCILSASVQGRWASGRPGRWPPVNCHIRAKLQQNWILASHNFRRRPVNRDQRRDHTRSERLSSSC